MHQNRPALLLLDLRGKESRDLLEQVQLEWPDVLIIGFGTLRSEPLREAEHAGIYAAEDVNLEGRQFHALVIRAFDHLRVLEENRALRAERTGFSMPCPRGAVESSSESPGATLPILRFPRVFRRFENMDLLVNSVVESLAEAATVTRVRIFYRVRSAGDIFRLRAGLHCLPESHDLEYRERDPLVRWFERNAHLICRTHLTQNYDHPQQELLRRALDSVGAEVIVPLHAAGRTAAGSFSATRLLANNSTTRASKRS